ncbi:MAG: class I SAM-dependent methyltransferase [Candidatus Eisenbacteria bacterium]|nr:class I SAM-dependent methyltransferase [Candidatus Eisenbacteria bacterium]
MSLLVGVLNRVNDTIAALVERVGRERAAGGGAPVLLDVGCWDGTHTERYAKTLDARALGVEIFETQARAAEARGIEVARLDLETTRFPWPDASVDLVVSNQVFEHLKNVWRPMSEIHRVLKPGGRLILSVPNLGSLHNRVLLAFGAQPTSIRTLGPHVRGYTFGEIRRFIALDGAFTVERAIGVGFYPFPVPLANPFAALWPGAAHTTIVVARKTGACADPPWESWYRREREAGLQSSFE